MTSFKNRRPILVFLLPKMHMKKLRIPGFPEIRQAKAEIRKAKAEIASWRSHDNQDIMGIREIQARPV